MLNKERFPLIYSFFVPPENSRDLGREWVRKNNAHIDCLVANNLRRAFFDELDKLGRAIPNAPEASIAHLFICKAAVALAGPWDTSVLLDMLTWEQILNARDNSLIEVILGGIARHGHAEDAQALETFYLELGKMQRLCYREGGTGKYIRLPGMVRLRQKVRAIVKDCELRGSRESEAARIAAGAR